MSPRQRGAVWFLAFFVLGRSLDFWAPPFIAPRAATPAAPPIPAPPDTSESLRPRRPTAPTVAPAAASVDSSAPLAINDASAEELQRLPRVGPVLAARIVAERQARGPFRTVADLERVPGIGQRTAARLAPLLRFD